MEFRILGPVQVSGSLGSARVVGARQLAVLVALLLRANRVVPVEQLIDAIWGDAPPGDTTTALQACVSRLRRALDSVEDGAGRRIVFATGYRLDVEPGELDLDVFREHVQRARTAASADRLDEAAKEYRSAIGAWRGAPLADAPGSHFAADAARLAEEHLVAVEERIAVELDLGRHGEILPELRDLVVAQPLRARPRGQLMLALHRSGSRDDALAVFEDVRRTLADELGIDPSPELHELRQRILRADPALAAPAPRARPGTRNDLPGDLIDFTGRDEELRRLLAALPAGHGGGTVVIEAIDGMAGIGKTALAVHTAHRLVGRYPDAQLFIDLHGHTPDQDATDPADALDTLLRALGVAGREIPAAVDQRSALWRAELAGRKVLVVLDNAADAAQVRPLLPGTSASLVLVTSRRRLADLDAARTLSLDVLPLADAVALFRQVVRDERPDAEREAVEEVLRLCGYLPLAIRIAAARLRTRPAWTVAHLLRRLAEDGRRLGELATEDRSVAAAFSLSYQHLDAAQQRLFRLLGRHPGPDFDAHAAAALGGIGHADADRLLGELTDVNLVQEPTAGRYRFHDLLWRHAMATDREAGAEQDDPVARLVDYYLRTAHSGERLLDPNRPPIDLGEPVAGTEPRTLPDQLAALAWFDTEYPCLVAVRRLAAQRGWHPAVARLVWSTDNFHIRRGHHQDHLEARRAALEAMRQLGDPTRYAEAHRFLGHACARAGNYAEAVDQLQQALALAEQAGDVLGQAHAHGTLAWTWEQQGEDELALPHTSEALRLFRLLRNPIWEAAALNALGWLYGRLGRHDEALRHCEQALALCRQEGEQSLEGATLDSLGYLAHRAGRHEEALSHYRHAVALRRTIGNSYGEADTLSRLAEVLAALGRRAEADQALRQALDLYRAQHRTAEVERVTQELRERSQDLDTA
ncbi:AfsR/SARP family transcriptional regulator [Solihabitans fulvus]|uniref:AfsR/SARP family transcriptional regulator n=1 Tax=Solihabitans fulvus TaxID=1892852 RepID=UPI001CB75DD3|nr:AfsR/SARP family transcriptional regulator [Solihabitans fulvus]